MVETILGLPLEGLLIQLVILLLNILILIILLVLARNIKDIFMENFNILTEREEKLVNKINETISEMNNNYQKTIRYLDDFNKKIVSQIEIINNKVSAVILKMRREKTSIQQGVTMFPKKTPKPPAIPLIDSLENINCIFRDDGLILYGRYDPTKVAYIAQALRSLKNFEIKNLSFQTDGEVLTITSLGVLGDREAYSLVASNTPVRIDVVKIREKLIRKIG